MVTKKPQALKFYIYTCDLESERSLSWGGNCIIFTKNTNKWYKIVNNEYVETQCMAIGVSFTNSYSWGGGGGYDGDPQTIQQSANYRLVTDTEKNLWNSKAPGDHNHDGVYQPAGNYADPNHNHDLTYASVNHDHNGVYSAANHNHDSTYATSNHTHNGLPLYARVTGLNVTTTGQSLVDITGLSLPLLANSVYEFEVVISIQSSSTAGNGYGINFSAAGANIEAQIHGTLTATASKSLRISALNTAATPYCTIAGTGVVIIKGIITTGANTGNLTAKHMKVTSGTSTVFINSFIKAVKVA
jgi:hypothetical protein